MYQYKVSAAL